MIKIYKKIYIIIYNKFNNLHEIWSDHGKKGRDLILVSDIY